MAFWRRSRGRHALGAAVTSLPTAPPLPALRHDTGTPPPPVTYDVTAAPAPPPPAPPSAPPGPRVELTFRDGSSASLDAVQARALDEIAQVLTRRD